MNDPLPFEDPQSPDGPAGPTRPAPDPPTPCEPPVDQAALPDDEFDLLGPLPSGTTVLEASAGTGKTYAIAALVARYVAEGVADLDELLMVTFSRMATNELRSRIRSRLVEAEQALRPDATPTEPLLAALADATDTERAERHARIVTALSDFDAATIATTHEFCLRMLSGLGVLGEGETDPVYVEDIDDLTREVATDCYLEMFAATEPIPLPYQQALRIAEATVASPHAELAPAEAHGAAGQRFAYAQRVREEVRRRKLAQRILTYDDMLTRLRDSLVDPDTGAAAADRLAARYRVVLIDEFQDTDPIQWEIVQRAFVGRSTVVLIGDPKQAIYAFRGADVFSYTEAVRAAGEVRTLSTNYRSDAELVAALDVVLRNAELGEGIQVRPVRAAHTHRRLVNPIDERRAAPLRLRYRPDDPADPKLSPVGPLRRTLREDVTADIVNQLGPGGSHLLVDGQERRVRASDIAILVPKNRLAEELKQALTDAGVPAVLAGAASVYAPPIDGVGVDIAAEWAVLLTALERADLASARRLALTIFVGWDLPRLVAADDDELTNLVVDVRTWARLLHTYGVAALLESVTARTDLMRRLLSRTGGDRLVTDLRHIGQALHAAQLAGQLGLPGLIEWLAARRAEARGSGADDRTRRLDTDAEAVQILTTWKAKGLEFPIVYLPYAWDRWTPDDEGHELSYHVREDARWRAVLDVGGAAPGRPERWERAQAEDDAESLRQLYVELTRAQCQVVLWWLPSTRNTSRSPLHRILFTDRPGAAPRIEYSVAGDPSTLPHLGPGLVSLEALPDPPRPAGRVPDERRAPTDTLRARTFDRVLDDGWRRTSYSSLTAAAHAAGPPAPGVSSEAEPAREDDEALAAPVETPSGSPVDALSAAPATTQALASPLADFPGGTDFGTLVHAVAEHVDPTAADLRAALLAAAAAELARVPPQPFGAAALAEALLPVYLTPLGELAQGQRLADLAPRDRLAELTFELPMSGGDPRLDPHRSRPAPAGTSPAATDPAATGPAATGPVLAEVAELLRQWLPADDVLAAYADDLTGPPGSPGGELGAQPLRGYLNGSIDAVLRVRGDAGPRYLVVDYKTNRLGSPDRPLTVADYTREAMAAAMRGAHYPLQALLYAVALHRFLRWRQPSYDPHTHLGGVAYLFVRGMAGPTTPASAPDHPTPCGVFDWRPPAGLVVALSDLLDRRTA